MKIRVCRWRAVLFVIAAAGVLHSLLPSWYHKRKNPSVLRNTGIPGTLMLTFDDGPDCRYTGRLLDVLKEEQVKAVFFTVTRQAKKNRELLARMKKEGHVIGFHSIDHANSMIRSYWHTKKEFDNGVEFLRRLGVLSICYRPPWGLTNLFTWYFVRKYRASMILWDVMAEDWEESATVSSIVNKCLSRVRDGSVICLHDAGERSGGAKGAPEKTIEAVRLLIPELKRRGYRFILPEEWEHIRKEGEAR